MRTIIFSSKRHMKSQYGTSMAPLAKAKLCSLVKRRKITAFSTRLNFLSWAQRRISSKGSRSKNLSRTQTKICHDLCYTFQHSSINSHGDCFLKREMTNVNCQQRVSQKQSKAVNLCRYVDWKVDAGWKTESYTAPRKISDSRPVEGGSPLCCDVQW